MTVGGGGGGGENSAAWISSYTLNSLNMRIQYNLETI